MRHTVQPSDFEQFTSEVVLAASSKEQKRLVVIYSTFNPPFYKVFSEGKSVAGGLSLELACNTYNRL